MPPDAATMLCSRSLERPRKFESTVSRDTMTCFSTRELVACPRQPKFVIGMNNLIIKGQAERAVRYQNWVSTDTLFCCLWQTRSRPVLSHALQGAPRPLTGCHHRHLTGRGEHFCGVVIPLIQGQSRKALLGRLMPDLMPDLMRFSVPDLLAQHGCAM